PRTNAVGVRARAGAAISTDVVSTRDEARITIGRSRGAAVVRITALLPVMDPCTAIGKFPNEWLRTDAMSALATGSRCGVVAADGRRTLTEAGHPGPVHPGIAR